MNAGDLLNRISSERRRCSSIPRCSRSEERDNPPTREISSVEAIAHGATQQELLADFDYLSADDIAAALLYAARATEHRIVHTA